MGFKTVFDYEGADILPIQKDAAAFLENSLKLFLTIVSGSFDYIERNTLRFKIEDGKLSYELGDNPDYKFPSEDFPQARPS